MGAWAGAKLARVIDNTRRAIAIEWIVGGQALEIRRPRRGGRGSEAALAALRARVEPWARDRSTSSDIAQIAGAIADGSLVREVRSTVPF